MIAVRPSRPSDHAYVAATALKQVGRFVRHRDHEELALVVRAMLNTSRIVVACSESDDDTLFGWAAAVGGVPWFVFVARDVRGHGVGARLRLEVTRGRNDSAGIGAAHRWDHDGDGARARFAGDVDAVRGARP